MNLTEIQDVSTSDFAKSKLDTDVLKLFCKIKSECHKSNPSTSEGILTHLFYCIKLFNNYKIDSLQLINSVKALIAHNFPHLYYCFIQIMQRIQNETHHSENGPKISNLKKMYKPLIELRNDIDFSNLNECGPSYRLLPPDYNHKQCSGRLNLNICQECLNDDYICFPSMTSEDTSAVSSKKNVHEDQMHRLEDERYEVDMFQEINKYALKHLSEINKKMESMSKDEKLKFQLDDNIGGSSSILMRKAIYRIYGDATDNMIEGLKVRPKMAIPLVISRMQEKAKEWNQIHLKFKMVWEDRANKHYWQSLDYQGDWIKRDALFLKRSTFFSQIESLSKGFEIITPEFFGSDFITNLCKVKCDFSYDYNVHSQFLQKGIYGNVGEISQNNGSPFGPHLTLLFPADSDLFSINVGVSLKDIIENANNLIISQINSQNNMSKEDKQILHDYIYHIIGYYYDNIGAQIPLIIPGSNRDQKARKSDRCMTSQSERKMKLKRSISDGIDEQNIGAKIQNTILIKKMRILEKEEVSSKPLKYSFIFGNSYIYTFIRLYHVLIDRLTVLKTHAMKMNHEDNCNDDGSSNDDKSQDESDRFMKVMKMLMDCNESGNETTMNIDNKIRILFTTKAFLWFTIPRVVQQIIKISQQIICAGLESSKELLDLYCEHSNSHPSGTGGIMTNRDFYISKENKYVNKVMEFCINQGLMCFLMIYIKQEGRLLIQVVDTDQEKSLKRFSNVISECDSPRSTECLKLDHLDTNILSEYEKLLMSYTSMYLQLSKIGKVNPTFLMKNVRKGVRKLLNCILNFWQQESLRQNFPSLHEMEFLKCNAKVSSKNNKKLINNLQTPIREMLRNAFIGNGDIYNILFERNLKNEKNGFIAKKSKFRQNGPMKKKSKISINDILFLKSTNNTV